MRRTTYTLYTLLFLLLTLLLLAGCSRNTTAPATLPPAKYELTTVDLFAQKDWKGTEVSVFGIQLGNTKTDVVGKLGAPDLSRAFGNTSNFEYSKSLAMPHTGLLFHFVGDKLTRITVKEPFNRFLGNETKIGPEYKEAMYRTFGAPSKIYLLSHFATYTYKNNGIEIFLDGKKLGGFSLVLPEAIEEFEAVSGALKNTSVSAKLKKAQNNLLNENATASGNDSNDSTDSLSSSVDSQNDSADSASP